MSNARRQRFAVAKRGLPFEIAPGTVVSGYAPIRNEIDPTPLMLEIAARGGRRWRFRR